VGKWLAFAAALLATACAHSVTDTGTAVGMAVSGQIDTSFDGIDVTGITASINGQPALVDDEGRYRTELEPHSYFEVRIEGQTIHTAIQTFGIAEIYDAQCECLRIPSIEVVARKDGRTELFFAGDAMAGRRYIEPIWGEKTLVDPSDALTDIKALLEPMRPYIESADLASVNLEIVLSSRDFGNSPPKSVVFYAPPELAQALKDAGFDHVSLGNNHSYDYLEDGLITTIEAVEAAGLAWSGAGLDEEQALRASRLKAGEQDFCLLGYVGWKGRVEPNQIAEPGKGGAAYGSDANINASVSREAKTGCTVIAQYHGSREYSEGPTEESERRMKLAVDSGATLIASHHPHVAHGLEIYNGALIAYSTGNFLFDQYFLETHGSFALRAWLEDGVVIRAEVIPIRVLDYRPVPAVGSMRENVLNRIARLSRERGSRISRNGGHGVINLRHASSSAPTPWPRSCDDTRDLLRAGDFENAVFGDAIDRSLKVVGGELEHVFSGVGGNFLDLTAHEANGTISLTTSTFLRVLPSNQFSVVGRIRADTDIRVTALSQSRPLGMGRIEALEKAPFTIHGNEVIQGDGHWQDFAFHFTLAQDKNRTRPFRPKLMFSSMNGDDASPTSLQIDDLQILAINLPSCLTQERHGPAS